MNLLYEPPELPDVAWTAGLPPTVEADVEAWFTEQLAGRSVRRVSARETETARGWPLALQTFESEDGLIVFASYRFFDLAAGIVIGGLPVAWLQAHDLEVAAALRAVEPDWIADEPVAISALWSEPLG